MSKLNRFIRDEEEIKLLLLMPFIMVGFVLFLLMFENKIPTFPLFLQIMLIPTVMSSYIAIFLWWNKITKTIFILSPFVFYFGSVLFKIFETTLTLEDVMVGMYIPAACSICLAIGVWVFRDK